MCKELRKRGKQIKILNIVLRKDMIDYGVAENMAKNRVE